MHVKIVCKDFGIKKVGKYCDLYLKSDIFGWCFWKIHLQIYQLDPAKSFSTPWFSIASGF